MNNTDITPHTFTMIFSYKEYIALVVFLVVFFLIIERRRFDNIPIWTSMLIGAALMVGFQVISIEDTFKSINLDVIVFLFGMFSIVSALDKSGVLKFVALKMLSKAKGSIAAMFVFTYGLWSSGVISLIMSYIPNPSHDPHNITQTNAVISAVSVTMSQILSNVPFVSLYINVMIHNGITSSDISQWMMLVAASTVAGNLTIRSSK